MERTDIGAVHAAGEALTAWYAAWNAHDIAGISDLCTPDIVYEDPGSPWGPIRGREHVRRLVEHYLRASPDFRLDEHERWAAADGSVIASYFTATSTVTGPVDPPGFAPTNSPLRFEGMDRSEIRDGLLSRHQIFYDVMEAGRQLGAVPARGSVGERAGAALQRIRARSLRRRAGDR